MIFWKVIDFFWVWYERKYSSNIKQKWHDRRLKQYESLLLDETFDWGRFVRRGTEGRKGHNDSQWCFEATPALWFGG